MTHHSSTPKNPLNALQRKLERMELEHLRQHALELHQRLEKLEPELDSAIESAEFWQRHAQDLQAALADDYQATHRCVGITRDGELLVLQQ